MFCQPTCHLWSCRKSHSHGAPWEPRPQELWCSPPDWTTAQSCHHRHYGHKYISDRQKERQYEERPPLYLSLTWPLTDSSNSRTNITRLTLVLHVLDWTCLFQKNKWLLQTVPLCIERIQEEVWRGKSFLFGNKIQTKKVPIKTCSSNNITKQHELISDVSVPPTGI